MWMILICASSRETGSAELADPEVPGSQIFDTTANGQPPPAQEFLEESNNSASDTFDIEEACVREKTYLVLTLRLRIIKVATTIVNYVTSGGDKSSNKEATRGETNPLEKGIKSPKLTNLQADHLKY